jgi:hypothetical protein
MLKLKIKLKKKMRFRSLRILAILHMIYLRLMAVDSSYVHTYLSDVKLKKSFKNVQIRIRPRNLTICGEDQSNVLRFTYLKKSRHIRYTVPLLVLTSTFQTRNFNNRVHVPTT